MTFASSRLAHPRSRSLATATLDLMHLTDYMARVTTRLPSKTAGGSLRGPALVRWLLLTACLFLIAAVAISPFALDAFTGLDSEWQRRSTVGQTYGAMSALLAALALGGVAVSVFLQRQESRASRAFAFRAIHIDLLKMAMDDFELRSCMTISALGEVASRQHLYCNLLFSFWETRYALGELHDEEITGLAAQLLGTAPGYRFWTNEREYRFKYVGSPQGMRFRRAFDDEYRRFSEPIPEQNAAEESD